MSPAQNEHHSSVEEAIRMAVLAGACRLAARNEPHAARAWLSMADDASDLSAANLAVLCWEAQQ